MTWDLEELGDDAVSLRRDDGLVLRATRADAPPNEGESAVTAAAWRFIVEDEDRGERLADHGWEIVDDEHLWEVLDGFTHRFRRDDAADGANPDGSEYGDGSDEGESGAEADESGSGDGSASAVESETPSAPAVETESAGATDGDTDDAAAPATPTNPATSSDEEATDRAVADGPAPPESAPPTEVDEATAEPDEPSPETGRGDEEVGDSAEGSEIAAPDDSSGPTDTEETTSEPAREPAPNEPERDDAKNVRDAKVRERDADTIDSDQDGSAEPTDEAERTDSPADSRQGDEPADESTPETSDRNRTAALAGSVQIREARPDDADRLASVYRSAYAKNRELGFPAKAESVTPALVGAWIDENGVIVATAENTVVGGVRLEATAPNRVKVSRLGVHADWKELGVGSKLLAAAEAAVAAGNAETVWLTTPPEHPFLPEFYRERGYERTDEYPLDERDYDEIVMEKRLGE